MKKIWIGLGSALTITVIGSLIYFSLPVSAPANTSYAYEYYYNDKNTSEPEDIPPDGSPNKTLPSDKEEVPAVDTDPASVSVLVNHLYTLPADYVPEDLVAPEVEFSFPYMADKRLMRSDAAAALEDLFAAASKDGIRLTAISGYRSYDRQKTIYLYNVNRSGEDYANLYSAPPGHSEHQTGLTMDVSSVSNNLDLTYTLADLPEGQWLAEHSHQFGFIIRYPEDKEAVTGYAYEPWHLRYVGAELASYLYEQNLTLDEYYGVSAEDYEWDFDYEAVRRNPGDTLPDDVLSYPLHSSDSESDSQTGTNQGINQGNIQTKPDNKDVTDTNPEKTDSEETDSEETDSDKTDSNKTDSNKTDSDKTDSEKTDTNKTDSDKADSEKTDSDKINSDGNKPDKNKPDKNKPDQTETDNNTSDDKDSQKPDTDDSEDSEQSGDTNLPDDSKNPGDTSLPDGSDTSESDTTDSDSQDTTTGNPSGTTDNSEETGNTDSANTDTTTDSSDQNQDTPPASIGDPASSDMPEASTSGSVNVS